jgi:MHS family citrate/tricarballylate:H+ symporter-like MFS transporter
MADRRTTGPTITARQVAAVALGNALEFYDFLVFTFFAVQIAATFFPGEGGLLKALATFGAGFLTRPLGAMVLGPLGDRWGRKPVMLLSFTLVGVAGAGVALTPGYASIGGAAPVIVVLFRLVQGFALGGEVGAATAFLIEASPPEKRGLYVSLQYAGQNAATLVAGLVGVALSATLGADQLAGWGWRVAFLIGIAIVPVGLVLRRSLPETLEAGAAAEAVPPLRDYARVASLAFLMLLAGTIATYVGNYMTTYAVGTLHMPQTLSFGATVVVGLCGTAFTPIAGALSDRHGRRPVMLAATAVVLVVALPAFWVISQYRNAAALYGMTALLRTAIAFAQAASLVAITESLPRRVRSGSLSVIYALAISIFGGSTQFAVQWLIETTGDPLVPAWYLLAATTVGFGAMLAMRESAPRAISGRSRPRP